MKPILGITMGDACGIGPEIIARALADPEVYAWSRPVVIGDKAIMERAVAIVKTGASCRAITHPAAGGERHGVIDVLDLDNLPGDLPFAVVDARAGKAAYDYVAKAVECALAGEIQAIVTAPLNKEALHLAGCPHPGHTEILAALSGVRDYAMMLVAGPLRVIHVTTHVSMRQACDRITRERVLRVIGLADEAMRALGLAAPRIAVAGLNAHAGESGLFGDEEITQIAPAVREARERGIDAVGPIPPDTVFYRAIRLEEFDIVVVMYHDQGHIPIKLLGFDTGVNVTVGLPFVRTSVDHGTAFDRAGKGTADHRSMTEALRLGAAMAHGHGG
jgi:4-hydroxythreonine-4-phosphate dehydrogenase